MGDLRVRNPLTVLQWSVGLVILIEAVLFVMPSARHDFARTHMPDVLRMVLGWGEIAGAILLLIPQTVARGAWVLIAVFVLAIMTHLWHGLYNVGPLVIYAAATWTVAVGKGS